jgi:hypothetical protein
MHFLMASNYLRKSYKQRLPQTENQLNTTNYIPVRHMVSSAFGTLVLTLFLSRPSRHFPLDCAALRYRAYIHSLRGCQKTRTVGNDFSATHFRRRKEG